MTVARPQSVWSLIAGLSESADPDGVGACLCPGEDGTLASSKCHDQFGNSSSTARCTLPGPITSESVATPTNTSSSMPGRIVDWAPTDSKHSLSYDNVISGVIGGSIVLAFVSVTGLFIWLCRRRRRFHDLDPPSAEVSTVYLPCNEAY